MAQSFYFLTDSLTKGKKAGWGPNKANGCFPGNVLDPDSERSVDRWASQHNDLRDWQAKASGNDFRYFVE